MIQWCTQCPSTLKLLKVKVGTFLNDFFFLAMSDPKIIVFEEPVFGNSFPLSGRKRKIKEPKEAKEPTLKKLKGQ